MKLGINVFRLRFILQPSVNKAFDMPVKKLNQIHCIL